MKNYVQDGQSFQVTAPSGGTTSGTPFLLATGVLVVPAATAAAGAIVEVFARGVFDLTLASGITPTVGALAYWDDTAKAVTTTSSGNTKIGIFIAATGRVRLNGAF